MFKKLLSLALALIMVAGACMAFASCSKEETEPIVKDKTKKIFDDTDLKAFTATLTDAQKAEIKIGMICLHDTNSTYDKNFIESMYAALEELGINQNQLVLKTGIPEDDGCATACDELAEAGCDVIFADSFGHESFVLEAAKKYPNIQFCHATGTQAHTANLANYHNAFASIYEGRYVAGIVAGMKLNEMIAAQTITADQAKIGYVGAFPYAEVKSGYTSFFLGVRSVCPTATMEVTFTNSWYDEALEKTAAERLIADHCVLISQHADSMGAPTACETANVPNVSYNGSTTDQCPNTALISSRIDWAPYFVYMIKCVANGLPIANDFCCGFASGSVKLTALNTAPFADATAVQTAIDNAIAAFNNGTVKVFDTSKFTVKGEKVEEYLADVNDIGTFTGETHVIWDGAFLESYFRSAPYFDLGIDGITELVK